MRALAAILLLSPALVLADDVRCLQSSGSGKPIQLQLTLFTSEQGGWRGAGQVHYRGQPDSLPSVFKDSEEVMAVEDRPSEFRSTWLEVLPAEEKLGGRYQFHHQGAVVFAFTYTAASGKVFTFEEAPAALDASNNCTW
ncbi:hypothetical protein [Pseudomonas sp. ML96]|uniref:hypothetical protein n=1 Tax=Pseudomonas sp. ML96 TaxID=1523503 RepID=UPI00068C85C0|nr:hypothetical protein [Pseudomonas sp. ML96]